MPYQPYKEQIKGRGNEGGSRSRHVWFQKQKYSAQFSIFEQILRCTSAFKNFEYAFLGRFSIVLYRYGNNEDCKSE